MSAFRIIPPRPGVAGRLYHERSARLAVAVIFVLDDGSLELFPVECDRPPYPLTGRSLPFPDLDALAAFLEIPADRRAA